MSIFRHGAVTPVPWKLGTLAYMQLWTRGMTLPEHLHATALEGPMRRTLGLIAVAAVVAEVPAAAHHSFSAFYFEDQRVTIEGEIVEFQYRNPHAWVHVMVTEADGRHIGNVG